MDKQDFLKTVAFRSVCTLLAVIFFFGSIRFFDADDQTMGLFMLANALSALAYSNIFDPLKKFSSTEIKMGTVQWTFSGIGSMLQIAALFVYGLWVLSFFTKL